MIIKAATPTTRNNQHAELASVLSGVVTVKLNHAFSRLLEDKEILDATEENSALKEVLRFNLVNGRIPEADATAAKLLLQKSVLAGKLAGELDAERGKRRGSWASITELREAMADYAANHEVKDYMEDRVFTKYLRNMALPLHSAGYSGLELRENPVLAEAILDHIKTEFDLLKELRVTDCTIKIYGHSFTVFYVNELYRDVERLFGGDPETKVLIRTTMNQLFLKHFKTASEAKEVYDHCLEEAKRVFGADPETETLVRTAANLIYIGRFKTASEAKEVYDHCLEEAKRVFGADPETETLVRTAAFLIFTGRFKTASEAKEAYDLQLLKAKERARKSQWKGPMPNITGLDRDAVWKAFEPLIAQIGDNFRYSKLGREDAVQTASLAILEIFDDGERDATRIFDKMISNVVKEAAAFAAFNRTTVELYNRK